MKTYSAGNGFRKPGGNIVVTSLPEGLPPGATVTVKPGRLPIHVRHSPDGHSWGYGGSGPAQLALDLLWDVYGKEPATGLYQDFKFGVVARWDQDEGWSITEDQVRAWVDEHGGFIEATRW